MGMNFKKINPSNGIIIVNKTFYLCTRIFKILFVSLRPIFENQICDYKILRAMNLMNVVDKELAVTNEFPKFMAGDTVTVHYKIREGNKERIQQFRGVVIQRSGSKHTETFTVRKMSGNIGVERIFPIASPFIEKIELNKHGKVRRARIFYLRNLTGKKARIKEKKF